MRTSRTTMAFISLLLVTATAARGDFKQVYKPAPAPVANPAAAVATPAAPTPTPAPQVESAQATVAHGEALYRNGDIAGAAKVFEAHAAATGTPAEQSSTFFRLGVQWQSEAAKLSATQQLEARQAAASAYERTLQVNPNSGAALNNLAQIYKSEPANVAKADDLLTRAIALNDSRKSVYLLNRAALKRDAGDLSAATELAKQAAAEDKGNLEAHKMVMNVALLREDAAPLLAYINDLNARGLVVRALDSAAEGLTKFPNDRKRLLTSVARTVSNSAYTADPWALGETDAGRIIGKFRDDAAIGAGVNELFQVLHNPVPVGNLHWWKDGFSASDWPHQGSPADAMQNLTRRCGEIYHVIGDERAEGYYRLSVELNGRKNVDSRALLGLAEILYEKKRLDDLNKLLTDNEPGLLEAKGRTLAASDHLHTYELRLALGMMYGYVGRWKNNDPYYASSIWMLDNAQLSANEYNKDAHLAPAEQIKLPPNGVKMLSTGYAKTGDPRRSVEIRLSAAAAYLGDGQMRFAQMVLDKEWQRSLPNDLDAGQKQRLAELTARAGTN